MGLSTDLLPLRSPVFMLGIIISSLATFALTLWGDASSGGNSVAMISIVMFILGASLNGSSIIIAAIECDLGKQEILKNNHKALATVSGIIDGIAGFGSILGQILIGVVKQHSGWRPTFLMLTIATAMSGVPASVFAVREYREWKALKEHKRVSLETAKEHVSNQF